MIRWTPKKTCQVFVLVNMVNERVTLSCCCNVFEYA